jgi:tetratricopeptide (TPR) repeat protein
MLTATAAMLLQEGPEASRTAHEALGLGRLYEMSGLTDKARQCFSKAALFEGPSAIRGEALRAYAVSCRRARRFEDAADAWRRILDLDDCPAAITKDATDALAVHHEHRLRDLRTARTFAVQALELSASGARHEAARHRVARLERKLTPAGNPAPLFT